MAIEHDTIRVFINTTRCKTTGFFCSGILDEVHKLCHQITCVQHTRGGQHGEQGQKQTTLGEGQTIMKVTVHTPLKGGLKNGTHTVILKVGYRNMDQGILEIGSMQDGGKKRNAHLQRG